MTAGRSASVPLDRLRRFASVPDLRERAGATSAPTSVRRNNAHIHLPPNFSAFASVEEAIERAVAEEIAVLGASNYYDYTVYGELARRAQERGVLPLFGVEIIAMDEELRRGDVLVNDPGNPGKFYLCGKGVVAFESMTPQAGRLLGTIRRRDGERIRAMIARLDEVFARGNVPLAMSEERVVDLVVRRHRCPRETVYLQERHVAQAFQQAFFAAVGPEERVAALEEVLGASAGSVDLDDPVATQNEIRSRLMKAGKPAYVEERFVTFEEARRLVLELGGIPSYPTLADGTDPICGFERPVEKLIDNIRARGLHAAELIPVRNRLEVVREYATAMRRSGLIVTAGTEHNTLDLLPLAPSCRGEDLPDDVRAIFWEGACVVAAHQFLRLNGEDGFVDHRGRPHALYRDDEERIAGFAALGVALIERYREVFAAPRS